MSEDKTEVKTEDNNADSVMMTKDDIDKMSCDQLADYLRKINNGYDLSHLSG